MLTKKKDREDKAGRWRIKKHNKNCQWTRIIIILNKVTFNLITNHIFMKICCSTLVFFLLTTVHFYAYATITLKIKFLCIFIKSLITNIRYYRSANFPSYPSCCIALYRYSHTQNNLSHICSSHFHLLSRFLSQFSQHSITPQLSSAPLPSFLKEKSARDFLSSGRLPTPRNINH